MPVFTKYEQSHGTYPEFITFGIAAYIYFMKPVRKDGDHYYGFTNGQHYPIQDLKAAFFHQKWQMASLPDMVRMILKEQSIWQKDLSKKEDILQNVVTHLESFKQHGALDTLKLFLGKAEYA